MRSEGVDLPMTCGACPQQYEGEVDGNPAYFRLRHGYWRFTIVAPGSNPVGPGPDGVVLFHAEAECKVGDGCMDEAEALIMSLINAFRLSQEGTKP